MAARLLWLTVGLGAGVGGSGIVRGVVAVPCPACAAEQRLEGQQVNASNRDPNTSSGQDVQGIVHPQVHQTSPPGRRSRSPRRPAAGPGTARSR